MKFNSLSARVINRLDEAISIVQAPDPAAVPAALALKPQFTYVGTGRP